MLRKSSLQNPWFRDSVLDTLYIFLQKRTLRIWRMGTARKKKDGAFFLMRFVAVEHLQHLEELSV